MNTLRNYIDIINTLSEAPVGQPLNGIGGVGNSNTDENVPQRPRGIASMAWDRKYGATHNADGSPKASDTPPQAQTTAPAQPQAPSTDSAPARPSAETPGLAIDADATPEKPQAPETDPLPITVTGTRQDPDAARNAQIPGEPDTFQRDTGTGGYDPVGTGSVDDPANASQDDADSADSGTGSYDPVGTGSVDDPANASQDDADSADSGTGSYDPVGTGSVDDPANQEPLATGPQNGRGGRRGAPQTDAELDADSADNAETPAGDSLAGKLNTEAPSLMDKYNAGGKKADDDVKNLQTGLSRLGFDPNGIDGKYGNGTFKAVQEFQKKHGLQVDGEAGPATIRKMQELLNGQSPSPQTAAPAQDPEEVVMQQPVTADPQAADAARRAGAAQRAGGDPEEVVMQQPVTADPQAADAARRAGAAQRAGGDPEEVVMQQPVVQEPTVSKEVGMQWAKDQGRDAGIADGWNLDQFKSHGTYIDIPNRDGTVTRAFGKQENLQNFIDTDRRGKGLEIQGGDQESGAPDAERDSRERGVQTASKEFDMTNFIKEMKDLEECGMMPSGPEKEGNPVTMSVTLNASGEQHVQDLIRMMQLAGAQDAAPVADMHVGPMDKHDDMVNLMRLADEEHGPEESVEEEWDNAPTEDYKDHKYMTKDLSGGLNREKKAYAKAQDGDNAMAVESIKDQLLKALSETGYNK